METQFTHKQTPVESPPQHQAAEAEASIASELDQFPTEVLEEVLKILKAQRRAGQTPQ
jgi:hypothetical protein